jgi:pimeloyl-ACP methyl ester carboxylesterase
MELPEEAHQLFLHSGGDRQKQSIILDQACLDLADADRERLLDDAGAIPADCIKASFEAWTGTDFSDRLCDITAETLVVGSDDPFLPPEFLDQAVVQPIADARFTHIPQAGHYVQVERTSQTKGALEDFLG